MSESPKRETFAREVSQPATLGPSHLQKLDSFPQSQNPPRSQPEPDGNMKLTWLCFRQFVLRTLPDDVTPEDATAKYSEFETRLLNETLESMRGLKVFSDMYNPFFLAKHYKFQTDGAQSLAHAFLADMTKKRYGSLQLVAEAVRTDGTCEASGHLQAPHFAFDANMNALCVKALPPTVSAWAIKDFLKARPGCVAVSKPKLVEKGLARDLHARFQSVAEMRQAVAALSGAHPSLRVEEMKPSEFLEAMVLPADMSRPEQIVKDTELSARVIRKLDEIMGISHESVMSTDELLGLDVSTEAKLDLQILYLRRVHHFCFYGCQWCSDEWELLQSCGPVILRQKFMAEDGEASENDKKTGAWAEMHDRRLEEFIAIAAFKQPVLPSLEEEPMKGRLEALYAQKTKEITPQKFQCTICGKCFKGTEYVTKHLKKVHHNLCDEVLEEVCRSSAEAAYLEDPARLGWPPAEASAGAVNSEAAVLGA